ncbi:MAG: lysylphosphatidylglycerol synthase transmembrane domain-containing protein [Thermoplasmatota archaeon]
MRRQTVVIGGLSALLILALVLLAQPDELGEELAKTNYLILSMVVLLYLANMGLKSGRWYVLLRAIGKKVPYLHCLSYFSIGQAFNNAIPGRVAGEAGRVYTLHSQEGINAGTGLATIVTERLMDLVLITVLAATGLILLFPELVEQVRGSLVFVVALAVGLNAAILIFLSRPRWIERTGRLVSRVSERVLPNTIGQRISKGILNHTRSFNSTLRTWGDGNKGLLTLAGGLTILIWVNEVARLYLIMLALGSDAPLLAMMIASALATLSAVFLSAGSGNVVMVSAVFTAAGVGFSTATTAGILSAMTSIWLSIPIGVLAMTLTGIKNVREESRKDLEKRERDA